MVVKRAPRVGGSFFFWGIIGWYIWLTRDVGWDISLLNKKDAAMLILSFSNSTNCIKLFCKCCDILSAFLSSVAWLSTMPWDVTPSYGENLQKCLPSISVIKTIFRLEASTMFLPLKTSAMGNINPFTPVNDQARISHYHIKTTSSRQVMRWSKLIQYQILWTNIIRVVWQ